MGFVPVRSPREIERFVLSRGFSFVSQRGSHRKYRNAEGRATVIPFHSGRDISPVLFRKILEDLDSSVDDARSFFGEG